METEGAALGHRAIVEAVPVSSGNVDFEQFRIFLEKACGILLGTNKQYLVSSRLNKMMEQQGIKSLATWCSACRRSRAAACASRWSMP